MLIKNKSLFCAYFIFIGTTRANFPARNADSGLSQIPSFLSYYLGLGETIKDRILSLSRFNLMKFPVVWIKAVPPLRLPQAVISRCLHVIELSF